MLNKLQNRWQLKTKLDVVLVLIVFTLSGTSIKYIRKPLMDYLGIKWGTGLVWDLSWFKIDFLYIAVSVVIISSMYQILFLSYGFILRQWEFVWRFERRMFKRLLYMQIVAVPIIVASFIL